jgi:hypothetical protein
MPGLEATRFGPVLGALRLYAQVAHAAQLLDRLGRVLDRFPVEALEVLHRADPAPLARLGDDRGGPPADPLRGRIGVIDRLDVVAVDHDRLPAERADPLGVCIEVPLVPRRAALAQAVDVEDRGQVVEPLAAGVLERLPHRALGQFAVAAQHPHPVGQPI